ncbi:dihydrolipoyl dehydrogenase family protein [Desulfurivibrio dismutans]|uniref:dihydrolipoyl dehydrogenase family protein n=1 Tax=Desulfurivibrio dismutans TaxID=1398908 RepID=UPI0023DA5707|nr:FAD-dependent oxidoreductase [Desulfurivibrio alkaliphilus]MDF1614938.1 FAD-dependent oxidoreductase [Desulfurivibrio alkaliphilus]
MSKFDFDLGVIGGGAAGLTVTSGAAQLGVKTLLVEKEKALGGDCLHYGCVPSKTLLKSAHVYQQMKEGPRFGLPAVDPPPVDFAAVAARIKEVVAVIQQHDSVERFSRLGAEIRFGPARFRDQHEVEIDGQTVSARAWVIATGSSPQIPAIPGLDKTPHLTNREIFYLDHLPASLLILGAGPIAVEMAQAFARLGSKVTVVQRSDQILSREDPDLAALVQRELEREGVNFLLNTAVRRVADAGDRREVVIADAAGRERTIAAEALLVALGRNPNTADLGLEAIAVPFDRRGIKVDRRLRAGHKHLFAAGDVIGGYQFTHVAGYEGGIALSNAVFRLPRKADYTWVPHCTYTRPELAGLGHNEKSATAAGLSYRVLSEEFTANDRAQAEGETGGRLKLLLGPRDRPLGVRIVGPGAGDILSQWVAIMNGKVGLAKIAAAIHPYPTLSEINKKVAGSLLAPKIFSPKVRKILKIFFGYRG